LAILETLCDGGRCVCELVPELGMGQTLLSYHLRILREARLVSGIRRGRRVEYTIRAASVDALMRNLGRLAGGRS
jgi:ArsR family transcriptional regulator